MSRMAGDESRLGDFPNAHGRIIYHIRFLSRGERLNVSFKSIYTRLLFHVESMYHNELYQPF